MNPASLLCYFSYDFMFRHFSSVCFDRLFSHTLDLPTIQFCLFWSVILKHPGLLTCLSSSIFLGGDWLHTEIIYITTQPTTAYILRSYILQSKVASFRGRSNENTLLLQISTAISQPVPSDYVFRHANFVRVPTPQGRPEVPEKLMEYKFTYKYQGKWVFC